MSQIDINNALLATVVTNGQTVAQVITNSLGVVSAPILKGLIDQQNQAAIKAAAMAEAPTVVPPSNASAIYSYIANTTADPNYQAALSTLNLVVAGVIASPSTNTWNDFMNAMLYLIISCKAGMPNA